MKKRTIVLLFLTVLLASPIFFWRSSSVRSWLKSSVQRRIAQTYLEKIEPILPFKIESLQIEAGWKDFWAGRIPSLNVVLNWENFRIQMKGPLTLQAGRDSNDWALRYESQLEVIGFPEKYELAMWVEGPKTLKGISAIGVSGQSPQMLFRKWNIGAQAARLEALWEKNNVWADLSLRTASWSDPMHDQHGVKLDRVRISGQTWMTLNPFQLGPKGQLDFKVESGEFLWEDFYLDASLRSYPVQADLQLNRLQSTDSVSIESTDLRLGSAEPPLLTIKADSSFKNIHWKTRPLPLEKLVALAAQWEGLEEFKELTISRGSIASEGHYFQTGFRSLIQIDGTNLGYPKASLAARNLRAHLPITHKGIAKGQISIDRIGFKHFVGEVASTRFRFEKTEDRKHWLLQIKDPFPLKLENVPLRIGPIEGQFPISPQEEFQIFTSMRLNPFSVQHLNRGLCLSGDHVPPILIQADFPEFYFGKNWIEPQGKVQGSLFDGVIEASEITLYHLGTEVPELGFSAKWNNLQLTRLGSWLGFGEMDGKLEGFARDVVFQSWLPTQFYFKTEVKPNLHSDIVFSPDAMKNFVRLFAGDDLDVLPGIAEWLAFGWPSRVFGGYDVHYVGISALSANGSILVETLDPPEILKKERKRFILYGPRFKMPLQSPRYPLVIDAPAMGNFVRHVSKQLKNISAKNRPKEKENDPDELSKVCLPELGR